MVQEYLISKLNTVQQYLIAVSDAMIVISPAYHSFVGLPAPCQQH